MWFRKIQPHGLNRIVVLSAAFLLVAALAGCAPVPMLPGGEPFGEQTAPEDETAAVYAEFCSGFRQEAAEAWDGCTVSWTDARRDVNVYRTQAYTIAYCEDIQDGEYLWYGGWLYHRTDDAVSYREMAWEELQMESAAAALWTDMRTLLEEQLPEELTYKYIPMAGESGHLLKAEYTLSEAQTGDFAKISVPMYRDRHYESVSFQWQDAGKTDEWDNVVIEASFFAFADSASLQAERKVWAFGHACGLSEEGVPSLSTQEDEREWCLKIVGGMDFAALRNRSACQEDLTFPEFPSQYLAGRPASEEMEE